MNIRFELLFLTIICLYLPGVSSIADDKRTTLSPEDKNKITATAQKLSLCAGVYDMVAEIHKVTNSPALSLSTHETANGAAIAAAFLMASTGIIPDWQNALKYAENTRNSVKTRQAALLEMAGNVPTKTNDAIDHLTESMKECNMYSELQAELVQKARIWMYASHPNK